MSAGSGFQLRVGQAEPTACARAVATQLQTAGRHFSTGGAGPWADKALGVRAGGEGALLQQAEVPVLQVSLADIANPAEERLASDAAWLGRQAAAVAKGLGQCLQHRAGGTLPAPPPAAAASGTRRA
jgi:N-acetylmuramoyl-L-alanine amidase